MTARPAWLVLGARVRYRSDDPPLGDGGTDEWREAVRARLREGIDVEVIGVRPTDDGGWEFLTTRTARFWLPASEAEPVALPREDYRPWPGAAYHMRGLG